MNDVSIIGIGSPFGNDTVGWQVIANIKQRYTGHTLPTDCIDLIAVDRPGMNLLHMMQGKRFVILVDAILDSEKHGEAICLDKAQIIESESPLSSHDLDVASAIRLGDKLGMLPNKLLIMGIAVDATREDPIPDSVINELTDLVTRTLTQCATEQTTR